MKTRIYFAIAVCVFLFETGSGQTQENEGDIHTVNALFVSNAAGMTFDGHVLTMKGIDRTITVFLRPPGAICGPDAAQRGT